MKSLFLEHFWFLLAVGAVTWVICATTYFFRLTRSWRRATLVLPPVFAVLLAINAMVVTDAEAIRDTIDRSIRAFQAQDIDALEPLIDESFDTGGLSKADLLKAATALVSRIEFKAIRITGLKIDPPVVHMAVWSDLTTTGPSGLVKTEWKLAFAQGPTGRWRYSSAAPLRVNNQPIEGLIELISLSH